MPQELQATNIVFSGLPAGMGEVIDVGLPGFTMNELDTSTQANSGYRTSTPGRLANPGELKLKHKWSGAYPTPPTSGNTPMGIYIPFPSGSGFSFVAVTFSGYLKSFQPGDAALDTLFQADSVIKVNGAINIA